MRKLTEDQIDLAKKMYRDGYLIGQIATHFSVSHQTAKKAVGATLEICKREHMENREKFHPRKYKIYARLTEDLRERIVQDYLSGMAYGKICHKHNVSEPLVNRALHTYAAEYNVSIPMRNGGVSIYDAYGRSDVPMNFKLAKNTRYRIVEKRETKTKTASRSKNTNMSSTPKRKDDDAYWEAVIADMCANPYR